MPLIRGTYFVAAAFWMLIGAARAATAQQTPPSDGSGHARQWITGIWIAGSPHNHVRSRPVSPADRQFAALGFRLATQIAGGSSVSVRYAAGVIPAELLTHNATGEEVDVPCGVFDLCPRSVTATAFGATFAPLGLEVVLRPHSRLSLDASANGGVALFDRNVPDPDARRFNFTANAASAVRVRIGRRVARIGVLYAHISNAHTRPVNPGINTMSVMLGVEL